MNIDSLFTGDYLKATDFSQPTRLTIKGISLQEIGQEKESKPVLYFAEESRGLILNKTNASMLARVYGPETDDWLGRPVVLHIEPVNFQGRIVDSIRVRAPAAPPAEAAKPADPFINDDISF